MQLIAGVWRCAARFATTAAAAHAVYRGADLDATLDGLVDFGHEIDLITAAPSIVEALRLTTRLAERLGMLALRTSPALFS